MHTVFSDGIVLPASRVHEAWLNGLDVIALTDHMRTVKEASSAFKGEVWLPRAGSAIIKLSPDVQSLTLVMSNVYTAGQQHLRVEWKRAHPGTAPVRMPALPGGSVRMRPVETVAPIQ